MRTEQFSIDLPRLPVISAKSQWCDQRVSLPDVRLAGSSVYTTSGRAAIALGLESLGISAGDRVLIPTYHCPTMVAPVVRLKAIPVFFPITHEGMPDMGWLERCVDSARAMLVPHYFGIPRDLSAVRAYCDNHGIALIEDCAHAFFGLAGDRTVGAWGDVATASLTKFFPGPDGGVLVIRSKTARQVTLRPQSASSELRAWLDTVEMGARYGRLGILGSLVDLLFRLKRHFRGAAPVKVQEGSNDPPDPLAIMACLDERLVPVHASAAVRWVVRTSNFDRIIDQRRRNFDLLVRELDRVTGVSPVYAQLPAGAVPYVCPILVRDADRIYKALRIEGIPVFRWDFLWPGTPKIPDDSGLQWSRALLQVACHQDLSEEDIRYIAQAIARHSAAEFAPDGNEGVA